MHHKVTKGFVFMVIILMVCSISFPTMGQISVTVRLNTCTNPDTLQEYHVAQIRGISSGVIDPSMTWKKGINMQNIGGDYWEVNFHMNTGDTLQYKFWTGFDGSTPTPFGNGWESAINPLNGLISENRVLIAGVNDTTIMIQYFNGTVEKQNQYWQPYATKQDSFTVYFRVNMGGVIETGDFDPENDGPIYVKGTAAIGGWKSTAFPLVREEGSVNNGSFWSVDAHFPNNAIQAGDVQEFKFAFMKAGVVVWESILANRMFNYSGSNDTTIHWVYFSDRAPTGQQVIEATVSWRFKTEVLERLGIFDKTIGDRVVLGGPKGWGAANFMEMTYVPLIQEWILQESFEKIPGENIVYKYLVLFDSSRTDTTSDHYLPNAPANLRFWEEPSVTGSANRQYLFTNQPEQNVEGDFGKECNYFESALPEGIIDHPITVTYNIDMAPATDINTNPTNPLFTPGVDTVWVRFLGSIFAFSQDMSLTGDSYLLLEDPDGNLVYSGSIDLVSPTINQTSYVVAYSTYEGGRIINGGGDAWGRRYIQFIHPETVHEDGSIDWPSEYSFPILTWKPTNLDVEAPPDLFTPTSVSWDNSSLISTFKLNQNFPNPFNPETSIQYRIAHDTHVKIEIYNVTGQLINRLVDQKQSQGMYSISWDGRDQKQFQVPSGIYVISMRAGSYSCVRKMMLVR